MEKTNNSIEMYELDIEELSKFILQTTRPNLKRQLEEYKKNLTFLLEEEKKKLNTQINSEKKQDANSTNTAENQQNKKVDLLFTSITKYAFENGDKFVKIYITDGFTNLKDHSKENILSKFHKNAFEVCILNWNKKNFRMSCNNLNKEIDAEGSYTKQTSSGLIVYLKKGKSSDHWDSLEKKKSVLGEDEEKPKKSNNPKDPNESLMDMMKEMYQSGDPEMKKIIAESFAKSQSGETPK